MLNYLSVQCICELFLCNLPSFSCKTQNIALAHPRQKICYQKQRKNNFASHYSLKKSDWENCVQQYIAACSSVWEKHQIVATTDDSIDAGHRCCHSRQQTAANSRSDAGCVWSDRPPGSLFHLSYDLIMTIECGRRRHSGGVGRAHDTARDGNKTRPTRSLSGKPAVSDRIDRRDLAANERPKFRR